MGILPYLFTGQESIRSMHVVDENEYDAIRQKIERAYRFVLKYDAYLLKDNVNERSITHRFAVYIEREFPEYHVDCEYNRMSDSLTRTKKTIQASDENESTVLPDIIVHLRGSCINLVVIEAKKTGNNDTSDKNKLSSYKASLGYRHAFFIRFPVGDKYRSFNESFVSEMIEYIQ